MGVIHGYKYDLFVSYAHLDDESFGAGERGWVHMLVDGVETVVRQRLGLPDFNCWIDSERLNRNRPLPQEIKDAIRQSALLLVVLSKSYLNSKWCRSERREFLAAKKNRVKRGELFLVCARPVVAPPEFRDLPGYPFWFRAPGARFERLLGIPNCCEQEFLSRIDELSYDIQLQVCLLNGWDPPPPLPPEKVDIRVPPPLGGGGEADPAQILILLQALMSMWMRQQAGRPGRRIEPAYLREARASWSVGVRPAEACRRRVQRTVGERAASRHGSPQTLSGRRKKSARADNAEVEIVAGAYRRDGLYPANALVDLESFIPQWDRLWTLVDTGEFRLYRENAPVNVESFIRHWNQLRPRDDEKIVAAMWSGLKTDAQLYKDSIALALGGHGRAVPIGSGYGELIDLEAAKKLFNDSAWKETEAEQRARQDEERLKAARKMRLMMLAAATAALVVGALALSW